LGLLRRGAAEGCQRQQRVLGPAMLCCKQTAATPHSSPHSPYQLSTTTHKQTTGGWLPPVMIRALHALTSSGLLSFPHRHDPPLAAQRSIVHPLVCGPHTAIASRSVGQLLALDLHSEPGDSAPPGAAAEAAAAEAAAAADLVTAEVTAGGAVNSKSGPASAAAAAEEAARVPLLDVMAQDWPGLGFLSGLAAFERRAVFSSAGGDHLIPWPSSSLRGGDELPPYPARPWLMAGASVHEDARKFGVGLVNRGATNAGEESRPSAAADAGWSGGARGRMGVRARLAALQRLPWRRFDVTWPWWTPGFNHDNICMHGLGGGLAGAAVANAVGEFVLGGKGARGGAAKV